MTSSATKGVCRTSAAGGLTPCIGGRARRLERISSESSGAATTRSRTRRRTPGRATRRRRRSAAPSARRASRRARRSRPGARSRAPATPRTRLISAAATTAPGQISRVFGRGLGRHAVEEQHDGGRERERQQVADEVERPAGVAQPVRRADGWRDSENEKTSTVAAPSTSARSSALRRTIGGRVSMSHAWLIAWRSAPITPLAATISSRTETGPSRPVLSSASSTVRSSRARSASCAERDVVEHGRRRRAGGCPRRRRTARSRRRAASPAGRSSAPRRTRSAPRRGGRGRRRTRRTRATVASTSRSPRSRALIRASSPLRCATVRLLPLAVSAPAPHGAGNRSL